MKCVMVMFDSLRRADLSCYGGDVETPAFDRLAARAKVFDRSYVCSMPCMPARRDLHTGRPSFLHRGWGPLEPWDVSVFEELRRQKGVYSHLATDHYHYYEDGGTNYHCRYDTWEFFRGQEGDPWIAEVDHPARDPDQRREVQPYKKLRPQDEINRPHLQGDAFPQHATFAAGLRFLDTNHAADDWLLQVECFDPHEPFFVDDEYARLFPNPDDGPDAYDWPQYGSTPPPELIDRARAHYRRLLRKCDESLGRVLDKFDEHGLWDDTMLIVWTDHGILLGEHGAVLKNDPPMYEEISHTPLLIHDPRSPGAGRRSGLTQPAIDLPATLYDFFGAEPPETMVGRSLSGAVADDAAVHDAVLFGMHAKAVNLVTADGMCCYRGDSAGYADVEHYTLRPAVMRGEVSADRLQGARLADPLPESRGIRPLVYGGAAEFPEPPTLTFDLNADPAQEHPLPDDPALLERMGRMMRDLSAPESQHLRLRV